jgi:hypothetical protein
MRAVLALALATLSLAACGSSTTTPLGCPESPCVVTIAGYVAADDDVLYIGSRDGSGVAALSRAGARTLLPLVRADGEPLSRVPGMDLAFAVPGAGKNVTVSWIGHARPSSPAGALEPLDLGDRTLTLTGTPGPDRLAAEVTGRLVVDAGDGNDVLVLAGATVEVIAGAGNDAVAVRDRGAGHVVDGGPGRDRLAVGGSSVTLLGGEGDDCLVPLGTVTRVEGGGGEDRSPLDAGAAVERGGLAGSSEGFVWCGPLAAVSADADAEVWPDEDARAIEAGLLASIVARRDADPSCPDGTWRPAPARVTGFAARRLQGVARAHAASVDGYPGPQSDAWAGGAFVPGHLIPDGRNAHQDRDGEWYDQRALRAGDPVTLAEGGVAEAVQRCPRTDARCSGDAAAVLDRVLSSFLASADHCNLLMGKDDPTTGVVLAVGVHRQDRGAVGPPLHPPGCLSVGLVVDDRGGPPPRP